METFLRKVIDGKTDPDAHRYFIRFGKGRYNNRFMIKLNFVKGVVKIRTSFELANDLVEFVNSLGKELKFSGLILTKSKIDGMVGRKKAGVFVYEVEKTGLEEFKDAYYYLLDCEDPEILLKIKKSLPKPGKDEEKIDDKFCSLDIDIKYWPQLKEIFFWDVPDCKKAIIQNDLIINEIEIPDGEKDPIKLRELARRKGKIVRRIVCDDKEISREYVMSA